MIWVRKEIFNGLGGKYPEKEVADFLNTLPEERALEAKIMICSTFAWVYYRTDDISLIKEIAKSDEVEEETEKHFGLKLILFISGMFAIAFLIAKVVVWFMNK